MSQIIALFYKNLIISKRTPFSILFQSIAPLFSLFIIILVKYIVDSKIQEALEERGDLVLPTKFYLSNLMNPRILGLSKDITNGITRISDAYPFLQNRIINLDIATGPRINRVGYSTSLLKEKAKTW